MPRAVAASNARNDDPSCFKTMSLRVRKFIGAIALFVLVIVWALVAMALAQAPAIRDNAIASIAYYVIAGIGWVVPAMPVVAWMSGGRNRKTPIGGTKH